MKKILLISFMLVSALIINAQAQDRTITGQVTDDEGSSLPGVNIILVGTTIGTTSDIDGNYSITVPAGGGVLQFSFIGFATQEIEIGNQTVIVARLLPDTKQLSEVVITGYGVERKRDVTGSIASVKGDVIENLPMQSFDRALQGRAAGVQVQSASGQPGGAINITIRGQGSLSNNQPLYIVDGVQVASGGITGGGSSNALGSINPNDIESMEILKDAAAAAIYGAQAANGVVIITTKRGNRGKSRLTVTVQEGINQPNRLYDIMDAQQFAEIKEEAYLNAGLDPAGSYAQFGNPSDPGSLTPENWIDLMFRDARLSTYDVSLQGGDEKTRFYLSGSYQKQEGIIIQSEWDRASLKLNVEHKASDKLTISSSIALARQHTFGAIENGNFVNGPFQATFLAQPNSQAIDPESGEYNPYPSHLPVTGAGHNFNYNILQGVNEERREGVTVQTVSSLKIDYQIMPELTFSAFGGIDFADNQYVNERPATIPVFAGFGGQTFLRDQRTLNWNSNATLNYSKSINEEHNISAIVGAEFKEESFETNSATGRGFSNPALRSLNNAATPQAIGGSYTEYKRVGIFGRVNYDYKNKYYLNFTLRRDGHSRFGEDNQYGTFWAAGASWRLKEESFMSSSSLFEDLKLRVSYGLLGNANGIGNFESRTLFVASGQYLGNSGQTLALGNNLLGWEKSLQFNIGIDYAMFQNRLYGAIDVWETNTSDQLFTVPLPTDSGFGSVRGNAGNVLNQGIDFEVGAVVLDINEFQWRSELNFSIQRNELTELPNGEERIGNTLIVGEPINFLYLAEYAGVNPANGRPMAYDTLGNLTYNPVVRDGKVVGSAIPTSFGGFRNVFSYKGISLDVFFQYQWGNKVFLGDMYNLATAGASNGNQLVSQLDRWQQPGDITNVPIAYEGGIVGGFPLNLSNQIGTTQFMSDGSYVRLKQVTLTYEFPQTLLSKIGFDRISVFVQGLNLYTWTNFIGIDPEVIGNNGDFNLSTYGTYPNGRQFSGGLILGF